jgi:hypothetical protein
MSGPSSRTNLGSVNVPHLLLLPLLLVSAAGAVLWICALVSVLRNAIAWRAVVWVLVTLVFPVLGPFVWFFLGRAHERAVSAGLTADQHADGYARQLVR